MPTSFIPIERFMTPTPHAIEPNETLAVARRRMAELKVRHLPVRSGGSVVGILSERDLFVLATFDVDFNKSKVGPAMTSDPFTVRAGTPLKDVATEMAERRIGSALVIDDQKRLLGIFTDTDALKAVSDLSQRG